MARPGSVETVRRVLAGFTAVLGVGFDLCDVQPANTLPIAARQIRYGFNNPVRAGLVEDPWMWPWSTLRDLGGAALPARQSLAHLSAFLERKPAATLRGLTASELGCFPDPKRVPIEMASPTQILSGVAACLRVPPRVVATGRAGRRLVVQVADQIRYPPTPRQLADLLQIEVRSIRRLRAPRHSGLDAAILCLADPRLRTLTIS